MAERAGEGTWRPAGPVDSVAGDEPCFVISVASRMVGVHAQTLRYYERIGLVAPARSRGNIRMYSPLDVQRAKWIKSLIDDLGINLAGVDVHHPYDRAYGGTRSARPGARRSAVRRSRALTRAKPSADEIDCRVT